MIKILQGNEFFIKEFIDEFIQKKYSGKFLDKSIVRNPETLAEITNNSIFNLNGKVIIWDFGFFKKFEQFDPFVIPKNVDIFIIGDKIDNRLKIVQQVVNYGAEIKIFKDLYSNQVENWILTKKSKLRLNILPDAIKIMVLLYGNNVSEISMKLDEFKQLNIPITKDIVNKRCNGTNAFSVFELQEAVTSKVVKKSNYILKQMLKNSDSNSFGIIRYFMKFFEQMIMIKLNDEELIASLNLHSYILLKLKSIVITIKQCGECLDLLRNAEIKIYSGIDSEYVVERLIMDLCRIK